MEKSKEKSNKKILDAGRYIAGILIMIAGLGLINTNGGIITLLLGISLLPFVYEMIFNNIKTYNKKIVEIVSPIIIFIIAVSITGNIRTVDKPKTSTETIKNSDKTESELLDEKINSNMEFGLTYIRKTSDENNEVYSIVIRSGYEANDLYNCGLKAQTFAISFRGDERVKDVTFECYEGEKGLGSVIVENNVELNSSNVDNYTSIYDTNNKKISKTMQSLKEEIEKEKIQKQKDECKTLNYKEVMRYPDKYSGTKVYWFGQVLQVASKYGNFTDMRVGVNCHKYSYIEGYYCDDTIYVTYYGEESIIEDDMIKIWGEMAGNYTYTAVLGNSITIPKVESTLIEIQ